MFRRTTITDEPTLAQRHNGAHAVAEAALSGFKGIIDDLDYAAAVQADVAVETQVQIDELVALQSAAMDAAEDHAGTARGIRNLFGL